MAAGRRRAVGDWKIQPLVAIGLTVLACLVADAIWFYLGRYRGNRVLAFLCRISLEPDSCVRRTEIHVFLPETGEVLKADLAPDPQADLMSAERKHT